MVSIVFCWWIMCVALMETWIAWRSLHHMRLAIHHVAHCFWICGRWSCVWSKNCLKEDRIRLVFRVEMQKARRLERIVDKFPISKSRSFSLFLNIAIWIFFEYESLNMKYSYLLRHLYKILFLSKTTREFSSPIFSNRSHRNTFIRWKIPDPFVFTYLWQQFMWSEQEREGVQSKKKK